MSRSNQRGRSGHLYASVGWQRTEAEPRRPQDWAYKLTDIECTNKQRHSQAELKPRGFKFVPLRQKDKISWTEAGHRSEHILL